MGGLHVDVIDSYQNIRYSISVGTSRPLYCTAGGQILLAFEDPEWVQNSYLVDVELEKNTENTLTNRRELRKKLLQIREKGIAVCLGELFAESGGIAAPVFGADGKLSAALGIGAPVERLRSKLPEINEVLREIAGKASAMR
jgi:DNA-binding IclR family transcriptional regulator